MLTCEHMGDAELVAEDGSRMLLKNSLYVPKIGVNSLSVRRLCHSGFRFVGNDEKMYIMEGTKKIVSARMQNGLYVVTNVAKGNEEKALKVTDDDEPEQEAISQKDKDRYLKYHRRFAHMGPKKIGSLHLVTNVEKIKIPKDLSICEVCALSKLRNKFPKELAKWAEVTLGRIQFDVAGPFPTSIRGNRWFLLIIDTCSRRNWVIPIKTKAEAYEELLKFKLNYKQATNY